jgi:hypothetical protein
MSSFYTVIPSEGEETLVVFARDDSLKAISEMFENLASRFAFGCSAWLNKTP